MVTTGPGQRDGAATVAGGALVLVIRRNNGSRIVTDLQSFTMTYPAHIADELAAWQRQLAPGQLP
jgi:hypothetical protein